MKISGRKIGVLAGALCFGASLSSCKNGASQDIASREEVVWAPNDADRALSDAQNALGFRILKKLDTPRENLVFSPFSIAAAFALVGQGTTGKTRGEIESLLLPQGFSTAQTLSSSAALMRGWHGADAKVQVDIANSLWLDKAFSLKPAFVQTAKTSFDASVRVLDLASAAPTINGWIGEKTHDKIKDMIAPGALRGQMLLVANAVYFKGKWQVPFEPGATTDGDFTLASGAKTRAPMMSLSAEKTISYAKAQNLALAALPYGNGNLSMIFVLPDKGVSLSKIVAQLDQKTWDSWMRQMETREGNVQIPRFTLKMAQPLDLVPTLRALGLNAAFAPSSDFAPMTTTPQVGISAVNHKAWMQVDESGTEAAASTTVDTTTAANKALDNPPFQFIADRPFLAAIRDNRSGSLLFLAEVNRPSQ